MKRNQWILVGTAGVLSVGALGMGAMSVANAMSVHDVAGSPVSGVQLQGSVEGTPGSFSVSTKSAEGGVLVAPSPTVAPSAGAAPSASPATSASVAPAPAPQPMPAPAPVAPDHSGVSAPSADDD